MWPKVVGILFIVLSLVMVVIPLPKGELGFDSLTSDLYFIGGVLLCALSRIIRALEEKHP